MTACYRGVPSTVPGRWVPSRYRCHSLPRPIQWFIRDLKHAHSRWLEKNWERREPMSLCNVISRGREEVTWRYTPKPLR